MNYNSFKTRFSRVLLLLTVFLLTASQASAGSGIYLRGSMNNWGTSSDWEFQATDDSNVFTLTGVSLSNGVLLKVADASWGSINYGSNDKLKINSTAALKSNGANITVEGDITNATLTLDLSNLTLKVEQASDPEPVEVHYYLKHPWGGSSWSWKELTIDNGDGTYSLEANYGGNGCNWNTTNADGGSTWVSSPTLVGNPTTGNLCIFTFNPSTETITITKKIVASITINPAGGEYNEAQNVTLTANDAPDGSVLQYRFNGTGDWVNYTEAIPVTETTTINAQIVDGTGAQLATADATYTIIKTYDFTIYFKGNSWETPYAYMWGSSGNNHAWPGTAMETDANGWWKITINCAAEKYNKIIFSNNGQNQTSNLDIPAYLWNNGYAYYDISKGEWAEQLESIPVYPRGVQSETELAAYDFANNPVVYLMGGRLNDNRISPEWQMAKGEDGKYHLNGFAMRSMSDLKVRKYTSMTDYTESAETEVDCGDNNAALAEGKLYNVTYDAEAGTITCTEDASAAGHMPFVSLVGYAMQQDQLYTTPRGVEGKPADLTTAKGWQEGWLQYDENGKLLKDRSGNVMYSTMWPPRNPVYFTANVEGERQYSSDQMTFKAQTNASGVYETKTGAEWKAELQAGENGEAYANLGTGDYELKDNVNYVRYVVPDIWYVGSAKIWTGWGGQVYTDDNGGHHAEWGNHANWGFGNLKSDDQAGTEISAEQPYYLSTLDGYNGNFKFTAPTYFKTIEFFYNVDAKNESRLYTTLAYGKAQIEAQSHKDGETYDYGQYRPQVTIPEGNTVQSYIIRCYDASNDKLVALNNGIVAQGEGDPSNTSFVNDVVGLAEGKYYYEMEVVFNVAGGSERTSVVRSNPFIIYFPGVYTLEPVALQLVEMEGTDHSYVTYNKNTENAPLYYVDVNADGSLANVTAVPEESRSNVFGTFSDNTKVNWSDKVLVIAPVPAQYKLDAEKEDAAVSLDGILNYTLNNETTVTKQSNGSMAYLDNSGKFTDKVFKAVMNYSDVTAGVNKVSEGKPATTEMARPNPVAQTASVVVEKVANTETISVDGANIAANYYKVNVELPFGDANVAADASQPAYVVNVNGTKTIYAPVAGEQHKLSFASINPEEFAQSVEVTAVYQDANGNYLLDANTGEAATASAEAVGFKKNAQNEIGAFAAAFADSKKLGKIAAVNSLAYVKDSESDEVGDNALDQELYKTTIKLADTEVYNKYLGFEKLTFMADPSDEDYNETALWFTPGDGISEGTAISIDITPVYPILVEGTMQASGLTQVTTGAASAPALKEGATYAALYGNTATATMANGIVTAVDGISAEQGVSSVRYYNAAGMMSETPFDGMNIVVTTYNDGTTRASKVVK